MAVSEANTRADSLDVSAGAELRATAKWMCAGAGGIAAVMVAGLQLKDLSSLSREDAALAVAATVGVVLAAGVILMQAAGVLAGLGPSIQVLASQDQADGGQYPGARIDEPKEALMRYLLVERRLELLGPIRDSIKALVVDQSAAHHGLWRGRTVEIEGRQFDPSNVKDLERLEVAAMEIDGRLFAVLAAAERWKIEERFRRLKITLAIAGSFLIAGVLTFAWITATATPRVRVTAPIPASIQVPMSISEAERVGFSAECAGETLQAVIVGGWIDDPVVITSPSTECPTHTISPGSGAAILPRPAE